MDIALAIESATKHVVDIKTEMTPSKVHKVNSRDENIKSPRANPECYCCGGKHDPSFYKFQDVHCSKGGRKGHLAKVSHRDLKKASKGTATSENSKQPPTHLVKDAPGGENVHAETMYCIPEENKAKTFEVTMELCGEPHKLEIDTGATRTVLNEETYNKLRAKLELKSTNTVLTTYSGEKIPVSGEVLISVKYLNQRTSCEPW